MSDLFSILHTAVDRQATAAVSASDNAVATPPMPSQPPARPLVYAVQVPAIGLVVHDTTGTLLNGHVAGEHRLTPWLHAGRSWVEDLPESVEIWPELGIVLVPRQAQARRCDIDALARTWPFDTVGWRLTEWAELRGAGFEEEGLRTSVILALDDSGEVVDRVEMPWTGADPHPVEALASLLSISEDDDAHLEAMDGVIERYRLDGAQAWVDGWTLSREVWEDAVASATGSIG